MSLFNLFRKKENVPVITDQVWMTQAAKIQGCLELLRKQPDLTLVAWSQVTKDLFQKNIRDKGIYHEVILVSETLPARMRNRDICFLEHHLFYRKEIELLQSWKCEKVLFLNSVEDPVFILSGSDRIVQLMEKMGMKEEEVLEHSMISKSIQRVQQKLEKESSLPAMPAAVKTWWQGIR